MGEYYKWVNIKKKEYISPYDFNYGNKAYESIHKSDELLNVLRDLLANEWKGDKILWLGDDFIWKNNTIPDLLYAIQEQSEECGCLGRFDDTICCSYKDVSGYYKSSETIVRDEIEWYVKDILAGRKDAINYYRTDISKPYKGLFLRDSKHYEYTINSTKKVCYSTDRVRVLNQDGMEIENVDPLPALLGLGRVIGCGTWTGDVIEVSDSIDETIQLLDSITLNI